MQTQAPKLGSILIAGAFTLAAVCVGIFFWSSFGGPLPLGSEGYRFDVSFPQAANLYPNASVRIAGVPVGRVVSTSPAGASRKTNAGTCALIRPHSSIFDKLASDRPTL